METGAPRTVGVFRETVPGERRVALVPDVVPAVGRLGLTVLIEPGTGAQAWLHDEAYLAAGAELARHGELLHRADVLLGVHPPALDRLHDLRPGQLLIALLRPTAIPRPVGQWADRGVTAIGLDLADTRLPEARPMDATTSQARIAGYRAVLLAAERLGRCLPPWGTADTAFEPVRTLVVGAGPEGLQAVDTARRLGSRVQVVELRRQERAQAVALGAELVALPGFDPVAGDLELGEALAHRRSALGEVLAAVVPRYDLVVTALDVPGGEPPMLLRTDEVAAMRPGSVLVDLTAGPAHVPAPTDSWAQGNLECARPGATTLVGDGVIVIGAGELAAQVPGTASEAYAHNVLALLTHLTRRDGLRVDPTDPVQDAMVVTHHGAVRHAATRRLLADATAAAGPPPP
ncbi:NAD(P) transhydrogenase subunit alpha [Kitasatospora griseola]|uniref:NAD(P) transhydrogenase subunit alpha n=1 Tax=Kitasatospora griseola TaxID=2064 RepID=UPI0016706C7C|nr:NAD(P) transhydrogenase subunit alpha [Kitasatospora griseola]GGQ88543.1 NAD(P) transhydrogenase subunit alpha [Kitasatospora griseola]